MKNDLVKIDLNENTSWTMGIAGLLKWFTWETENILGQSKTSLIKEVTKATISECAKGKSEEEITNRILELFRGADPVEIQKKIRLYSEDYLNREFDVFFSLLPSVIVNHFFSAFFKFKFNGICWNVVGNSGDFEDSMEMKFMQIDTIAYAPSENHLVAIELKVDAKLAGEQIKKYCFMAAYLEYKMKIGKNPNFNLMVICPEDHYTSAIDSFKRDAFQQIIEKDFPKKRIDQSLMESLSIRASEFIQSVQIICITWQQVGDYFQKLYRHLPDNPYIETHKKLISGFLSSLSLKKNKRKQHLWNNKTAIGLSPSSSGDG